MQYGRVIRCVLALTLVNEPTVTDSGCLGFSASDVIIFDVVMPAHF